MLLALVLLVAAPKYPANSGYVVDEAHLLSPAAVAHVTQVASQLDHSGVAQLSVVTVPESMLDDSSYQEYANELFKKWGVGHGTKRDDGVLVLFVPGVPGHRKIWIEVGYGLEGILPDGKVGQIRTEQAFPYMKSDDYSSAAIHVSDALAAVIHADAAAGGDTAPTKDSPRGGTGVGMRGAAQPASAGGLLVTLFAMGAVVIALIVAASRRHFPGKPHFGGAAAASGVSLIALFMAGSGAGWIVFIVALILIAVIWASIAQHRCPKCKSWMTIDEEVVEEPTYWSEGIKHITHQCTKCSYHREYDRAIPRKQVVVSSGGSGGGGSWGGGGGDSGGGFSGGGGGRSGGGGAGGEV